MPKRDSIFKTVAGYRPGRSAFDMSYETHLTCEFGKLYPVYLQEVYPTDYAEIHAQMLCRLQPTVSPMMSNIVATYHVFFVPNRILWDDWERAITRGVDGNYEAVWPTYPKQITSKPLPDTAEQNYWLPVLGYAPKTNYRDIGTLWDFLGYPVRTAFPDPIDLPRRAYIQVWNDYYRDENLIEPIPFEDPYLGVPEAPSYYPMVWLLPRAWSKDYFTSALPWQQRGTAPSVPLSGFAHAIWPAQSFQGIGNSTPNFHVSANRLGGVGDGPRFVVQSSDSQNDAVLLRNLFQSNNIDLTNIGTFTVSDLRLLYSVQRFQEIQARGGARYGETVAAQFAGNIGDARLQRAEYIGGCKIPVAISEVVQTSGAIGGTPQGNLAGHGLGLGGEYCGKFKAPEHGWLIGLLSFSASGGYQQGLAREHNRKSTFDYYWPVLDGLSEQAVTQEEIFNLRWNQTDPSWNPASIFGFQGRYAECRARSNIVCGQMRVYDPSEYGGNFPAPPSGSVPASISYYNTARYFANMPRLNWTFMIHKPRMDNFVVQNEPPFIVQWGNLVKMVRPMSYMPIPRW